MLAFSRASYLMENELVNLLLNVPGRDEILIVADLAGGVLGANELAMKLSVPLSELIASVPPRLYEEADSAVKARVDFVGGNGVKQVIDWRVSSTSKFILLIGDLVSLGKEDASSVIANYLSEMAEYMPGNFYWKDLDSRYLGCNTALIDATGLSSEQDLIGRTDYDLWGPQADSLRANDKQVMSTGKLLRIEESVTLDDGTQMYFAVIKVPMRNEAGEVCGVIGNSLDITEVRDLQQKLALAQKKEKAANKSKTLFLDAINKVLRTPLSTLVGVTQLLSRNSDEITLSEGLGFMEKASNKLVRILDRIPTYIELEQGFIKPRYEQSDLQLAVTSIITGYEELAENKAVKINFKYDPSLSREFIGPFNLLREVVDTLIHNALRFSESGHVDIAAKLEQESGSSVKVTLSVRDCGPGLPVETCHSIFSLFDDIAATPGARRRVANAGLQLSIVKKMVELLGGEIHVESEVGQGSVFWVSFWLESVSGEGVENAHGPADVDLQDDFSDASLLSGRVLKVLVVEDDLMNSKVLSLLLGEIAEKSGFSLEIDSALTFSAAERLVDNEYDIIFTDVGLPDGSGVDLMRVYRAKYGDDLPIIAVTANASSDEYESMMDAGMTDVAEKPVSLQTLELFLGAYLG